jgi:hypothetical protein
MCGGWHTLQIVYVRAAVNVCTAAACVLLCGLTTQECSLPRTKMAVPPCYQPNGHTGRRYSFWRRRCVSCKQSAARANLLRKTSSSGTLMENPFKFHWRTSMVSAERIRLLGLAVPFEFTRWLKVRHVFRCIRIQVLAEWLWVGWDALSLAIRSHEKVQKGSVCAETMFSLFVGLWLFGRVY